ncbi:SUF system Fe-S cluster assembly protein [Plebeiibacterium sediminum]|uniref:SUF system Fe-S cluster assembly protein n=1 Tax=Plebeiibacterium sediminum TaxID=2992112 RepID=A0AAE3M4W1_9BACT|nr:SUF system Fe-S cluster assembly protein [Plebeiobacterium sediminum]MCW3787174.1 SUF system Fe-S cluster assembly protein [Plebeiobacterium sediminum]
MTNEFLSIEEEIVNTLKTIFDPEIPVNIYDLGLIYEVNVEDDGKVRVVMTLTSPNCPVAESMPEEVFDKVSAVEGVSHVDVNLTFDPPWTKDMLSDEALLELGLL